MKKILFVALVTLTGCVTHIEAGEVGVLINSCSGGGVEPEPLPVGYHSTGPCTTIEAFPITQRTVAYAASPKEGTPNDQSITVQSAQGTAVQLDAVVSYSVEAKSVPALYARFKTDRSGIEQGYMHQEVRREIQAVYGRYTTEDLYGAKREASRAEIEAGVSKTMAPLGLNVVQVSINNIVLPPNVVTSINAKVAMTQDAERQEAALRKTKAEAAMEVAKAEGEAAATRAKADAEAYSNHVVSASLTPELIRYTEVTQWDGHTPSVVGAGGGSLLLDVSPKGK